MDRSWWLAVVAVMALALVVTLIDGWGRGGRPRKAPRGRRGAGAQDDRARGAEPPVTAAPWAEAAAEESGAGPRPRPAEIWWAADPHGERPAWLVLAVEGERVRVARVAAGDGEGRPGVIPLPPGLVDDVDGRPRFLETEVVRTVLPRDLRRRAGALDPSLWARVRHLSD